MDTLNHVEKREATDFYSRFFNSAYYTGGTKTIFLNGKSIEIHDPGNFQPIFEAYLSLKEGISYDVRSHPGRWAYQQRLLAGTGPQIVEILDVFVQSEPEQFQLMQEITTKRQARLVLEENEAAKLNLVNSIALDRLGDILASEQNASLTLQEICS